MANRVLIQIALEMWGAVFCVIFLIFIWLNPSRKSRNEHLLTSLIFHLALLLICDCAAWFTRGMKGTAASVVVRLSNYLVFVLNYALGLIVLRHVEQMLAQNGKKIQKWLKETVVLTCLLGVALVTVSQFTGLLYTIGADNVYVRAPGYWMICAVAAVMLMLLFLCVITNYKNLPQSQALSYLAFFLLTAAASGIQFLIYGISLVNISMTAGIVFHFIAYEKDRLAFAAKQENAVISGKLELARNEAQLARNKAQIAENEAELARNKAQIAENKAELARNKAQIAENEARIVQQQTQIVLSQIQPHFLYNALSAISVLCRRDPETAKNAVDNLADYLRANLDSLRFEKLISFKKELEHVNAYLFIEKLRFGEDLQIACDIPCEDFMIPSLTLQPLVENAIRHGICGKEDGGTITICTQKTDTEYLVIVMDDGVGFDPDKVKKDGRSHVGLENVRERLQLIGGGSLTISSVPGVGTKAVIHIPRKEGSGSRKEEAV